MFSQKITAIIEMRTSVRVYKPVPIPVIKKETLKRVLQEQHEGPFGTKIRFLLVSALDDDKVALKKMGTYGFVKSPAGYIVGVAGHGSKNLEDYKSYALEKIGLKLTYLESDSCRPGATFKVASFAMKIHATAEEMTPAVIPLGHVTNRAGKCERAVRWAVQSRKRMPWNKLFLIKI